jgi:hypothetical protein
LRSKGVGITCLMITHEALLHQIVKFFLGVI